MLRPGEFSHVHMESAAPQPGSGRPVSSLAVDPVGVMVVLLVSVPVLVAGSVVSSVAGSVVSSVAGSVVSSVAGSALVGPASGVVVAVVVLVPASPSIAPGPQASRPTNTQIWTPWVLRIPQDNARRGRD